MATKEKDAPPVKYRDFSEMPSDVLRDFLDAWDKAARQKKVAARTRRPQEARER